MDAVVKDNHKRAAHSRNFIRLICRSIDKYLRVPFSLDCLNEDLI